MTPLAYSVAREDLGARSTGSVYLAPEESVKEVIRDFHPGASSPFFEHELVTRFSADELLILDVVLQDLGFTKIDHDELLGKIIEEDARRFFSSVHNTSVVETTARPCEESSHVSSYGDVGTLEKLKTVMRSGQEELERREATHIENGNIEVVAYRGAYVVAVK